jgi:hypothetical protein
VYLPVNLATLRVEGDEGALTTMLSSLALEPDRSWKKGERRRVGTYSSSGFNVIVGDAENPRELIVTIRTFLATCRDLRDVFRAPSLSVELDIGFTVGDSQQFVAGLSFDPADLAALADLGIALCVTAYPTSDEANAEDDAT